MLREAFFLEQKNEKLMASSFLHCQIRLKSIREPLIVRELVTKFFPSETEI